MRCLRNILPGAMLILTGAIAWTQTGPVFPEDTVISSIRPEVQEHIRGTFYGNDELTQQDINNLIDHYRELYAKVGRRDSTIVERFVIDDEPITFLRSEEEKQLADAYRFAYVASTAQDVAIGELGTLLVDYHQRMEKIRVLNAELGAILESLKTGNEHSNVIIASLRENVETTREAINGISGVLESYRTIIDDQFALIDTIRAANDTSRGPTFSVIGGPYWDYGDEFSDYHAAVGSFVRMDVWKLELGIGYLTTVPPTASSVLFEIALPPLR